MKLLTWIFNIQNRYYRQGRMYAKGGPVHRVLHILILAALVAVSLVLEYFALDILITQGNILGIFIVIFAAAGLLGSIEMGSVYSYFAFKTLSAGSLTKWLEKAETKRKVKKQSKSDLAETQVSLEETTETVDALAETPDNKRKCPKWLDILSGVCFLGLTIAEVILIFVIMAGI